MKKFILLKTALFFFFFSQILLGQKTIKGQILNEKNQKIEYVNIGIIGGKKGSISDENGVFKLTIPQENLQDSLYFSHLNYQRKAIAIQNLTEENNKIILKEEEIILSPVEISATKPKLRTIKRRGLRFPGGNINIQGDKISDGDLKGSFEGGIGDFINLKSDYVAKKFYIDCVKNSAEKFLIRLAFYSVDSENKLTPIVSSPIYINIPQTSKKIEFEEDINVHLPKGKIWAEIQFVDFRGVGGISFPISFSGGWVRIDTDFEKIPLGIGLSFAIKGYKITK